MLSLLLLVLSVLPHSHHNQNSFKLSLTSYIHPQKQEMENNTENAIQGFDFHEPHVYGWIESRLNSIAIDFLWDAINAAKDRNSEDIRSSLAGQLSRSIMIEDEDEWFTQNVLYPLETQYRARWGRKHAQFNTFHEGPSKLELQRFWVNFQKQGEYNPLHDHTGLYSFVVWLNNPADHIEQCNKPNARGTARPKNNEFSFTYLNTLGKIESHCTEMTREEEGKILFFPSGLNHSVTPFYDCDEERVSVSGNLWLRTKESLKDPEMRGRSGKF